MLIGRIEGATRVLKAPADMPDCRPLAIKDIDMEGGNAMVSAWQPSPDELAILNNGGSVHLYIWGQSHPPVYVGVGRE